MSGSCRFLVTPTITWYHWYLRFRSHLYCHIRVGSAPNLNSKLPDCNICNDSNRFETNSTDSKWIPIIKLSSLSNTLIHFQAIWFKLKITTILSLLHPSHFRSETTRENIIISSDIRSEISRTIFPDRFSSPRTIWISSLPLSLTLSSHSLFPIEPSLVLGQTFIQLPSTL